MDNELTLEQLKAAVREHSNNPILLRMVGPDEFEKGQAETRLKALDSLSPRCEWDSAAPSFSAAEAREQWKRLMKRQGAFEARYC
jgi:hypothetical protein